MSLLGEMDQANEDCQQPDRLGKSESIGQYSHVLRIGGAGPNVCGNMNNDCLMIRSWHNSHTSCGA